MQLLDAPRASKLLLARLADRNLSAAEQSEVLRAVATLPTSAAALATLLAAADVKAPLELRREALAALERNLPGIWKELDGQFSGGTVVSSDNLAPADVGHALAAMQQLLSDETFRGRALSLVAGRGYYPFRPQIEKLVDDAAAPMALRVKGIEALVQFGGKPASDAVARYLSDTSGELRGAALSGAIRLQAWPALKNVLRETSTSEEVKRQIAGQMLASPGGALVLLRLIEAEQLPPPLADEVVAQAVQHADINVRVLFERFVPEEQHPQRLGAAIQPLEILKLTGDKERGQQIFFESTATQCKNCHTVHGRGGTLGPDLSQIGRKYERAALLETILDPSKAIAPEYVPHVLETDAGQVYVGLLLENGPQSALLVDAQNQTVRVPKSEIVALEPQTKSLMPELVLRDVSAQDAADLLAYLASLTEAVQPVTRLRVLGPFDASDGRGLAREYPPEKQLALPDLSAEYSGLDGRKLRWETVTADNRAGFWGHDLVEYCKQRGQRGERVVCYYLVSLDSPAAQPTQFTIDSDDNCRVWLNGQEIHKHVGRRALGSSPDKVEAALNAGRNTLVVKVENLGGPGGVSISTSSASLLRLGVE
jgi:putative heme-binding domain-containing protein